MKKLIWMLLLMATATLGHAGNRYLDSLNMTFNGPLEVHEQYVTRLVRAYVYEQTGGQPYEDELLDTLNRCPLVLSYMERVRKQVYAYLQQNVQERYNFSKGVKKEYVLPDGLYFKIYSIVDSLDYAAELMSMAYMACLLRYKCSFVPCFDVLFKPFGSGNGPYSLNDKTSDVDIYLEWENSAALRAKVNRAKALKSIKKVCMTDGRYDHREAIRVAKILYFMKISETLKSSLPIGYKAVLLADYSHCFRDLDPLVQPFPYSESQDMVITFFPF